MGEGGGPVAAEDEEAHHVAVGLFVPGLELEPAAGDGGGRVQIGLPGVGEGQQADGLQHPLAQMLAGDEHPLLERGAVDGEAVQKIAAVEVDGLVEPGDLLLIGQGTLVLAGLGEEVEEGPDVEPAVAGSVELEGGPGDEEEGSIGPPVAEEAAEVGEGVAEVAAGVLFREIGPQQIGEAGPGPWALGLDGEVGEERADLVGAEAVHGLAVQGGLEGAEQTKRQMGHGGAPPGAGRAKWTERRRRYD
ncbi:MAG: hypothetical protein U9R72_10800 [Chloroflexota bacterium]|nr:hypothetical protein [Chloroflexota bacterium]